MTIGQGDLDMGLEVYTAQAQNRLLVRREVFADISSYVKCSMFNTELNPKRPRQRKSIHWKTKDIAVSSLLMNQGNFEVAWVLLPTVNWGLTFSDIYIADPTQPKAALQTSLLTVNSLKH